MVLSNLLTVSRSPLVHGNGETRGAGRRAGHVASAWQVPVVCDMARVPNTTSIAAALGEATDKVLLLKPVDDDAASTMLKEFDRQVQELDRRKKRADVQPV